MPSREARATSFLVLEEARRTMAEQEWPRLSAFLFIRMLIRNWNPSDGILSIFIQYAKGMCTCSFKKQNSLCYAMSTIHCMAKTVRLTSSVHKKEPTQTKYSYSIRGLLILAM